MIFHTEERSPCPKCGYMNTARRVTCKGCGTDLAAARELSTLLAEGRPAGDGDAGAEGLSQASALLTVLISIKTSAREQERLLRNIDGKLTFFTIILVLAIVVQILGALLS